MKYLPFPFEQSTLLVIKTAKSINILTAELASSDVEIFQSLNYRAAKDFKSPLVLQFSNPLIQSLSLQQFKFDAEQILIEEASNVVRGVQLIKKSKSNGKYVQAYAGFSLAILAPVGFSKKFGIELNKTIITIK
jgi:hypothetical protein